MNRLLRTPYTSPFALWYRLASRTAETMLASAQVIGHRSTRMALAGPAPSARDRTEFARMGQEKVEAGAQSARAMTRHLLVSSPSAGMPAMRAFQHTGAAYMALLGSRTPGELMSRQLALAFSLQRAAVMMAAGATHAATLAQRGLAPIHAKATANAKRLAKR